MTIPLSFHTLPRLFVETGLSAALPITLTTGQSHYLGIVLRLREGDSVRLFNGIDGEWLAEVVSRGDKKRPLELVLREQTRKQQEESKLYLVCAPIKKAHFDDMLMKGTELGVTRFQPILTARTQVREVNLERCRAIVTEAAEQSERLALPEIMPPVSLERLITSWPSAMLPIVCAEWGEALPVREALHGRSEKQAAVITGPEGGFSADELSLLRSLPGAVAVRLGPRILRADTAALAALTCWQAFCGDWY